jgi:hypothetical protein
MALTRKDLRFLASNRMMVGWALAASVAPAYAAQSRTSPQDIYPATESETLTITTTKTSAPVATSKTLKQAPGIASTQQAAPARLTAKPTPDAALAYDLVPSDQVDPLGKRLQLVEILIRKYSRAYDYRAHTVKELNAILAKLDAASAPRGAALAAPVATQQVARAAAPAASLPTPSEEDEVNGGENTHGSDD